MAKQKAKFYVVWQGREAGIYDSWEACEAQVKGVAAKYKGFATRAEAEKAFSEGFEKHIKDRCAERSQTTALPDRSQCSLKDSPEEMIKHPRNVVLL